MNCDFYVKGNSDNLIVESGKALDTLPEKIREHFKDIQPKYQNMVLRNGLIGMEAANIVEKNIREKGYHSSATIKFEGKERKSKVF